MAFSIKVPTNVRNNIHKLSHVQVSGKGVVIHDPSGVSLHIDPVPGSDDANVTYVVNESIMKKKLEDDIAHIAEHPDCK